MYSENENENESESESESVYERKRGNKREIMNDNEMLVINMI
jgi:hypothetical protein